MEKRDGVWAHPDLLPDASDLDSPAGFIDSVIGGGANAFDDPLAQLAETEARERDERKKSGESGEEPGEQGETSS